MASFNVTRRALSLGARDTVTNWPAKEYDVSVIQGSFDPAAVSMLGLPLGPYPLQGKPFFTDDVVRRGDVVVDAFEDMYLVESVNQVNWGDNFVYYACGTKKLDVTTSRASTSGTWHVDSDSVQTDPRNRIKAWLDAHIAGVTGDYEIMFAGMDYPWEREFTEKGLELLAAVDTVQSTPNYNYIYYPYKFTEQVDIHLYSVDTATYTAVTLLENFEQSIRHVATDYPYGSIREITSTKPQRFMLGGVWLWQVTVTIKYIRANDDYTATYPRITWGPSAAPTGTYYFPNCVNIEDSGMSPDARSHPPGWVGNLKQPLGAGPYRFKLTCDLSVDGATYTWKRPQTATPKTDVVPHQVIMDIDHNGGIDQPYQTLALSANGPSLKVRYVTHRKYTEGDGSEMLEVEFEEYTATSQAANSLATRMGFS